MSETRDSDYQSAGMPVLILGGSGFIGTRLAETLIERGMDVRIGDIQRSERYPNLWTNCDVRDINSLRPLFRDVKAVINLAAEHRDDVRPISRYYETNVQGAERVCEAARSAGINTILFTSSVAVYGFQKHAVEESGPFEPFNPYGDSKLKAEAVYRAWADEDPARKLVIVRPTVVFGEGNRGNVYNLLKQIASGKFVMVGPGRNYKSMAYVGNLAEFIAQSLRFDAGTYIYNYVDSPDMNMTELVALVRRSLNKSSRRQFRIPLPIAMTAGHVLDQVARLTGRTFPISAIRIQKFCANTQVSPKLALQSGFQPRFSLEEGLTKTIRAEFQKK